MTRDSVQGSKKINARDVTTPDTLMDLIRQTVPPNIVQVRSVSLLNPKLPAPILTCISMFTIFRVTSK